VRLPAALAALVPIGCAAATPSAPAIPVADRHPVGAGAYATFLSPDEHPPSNARGEPVRPKVVEGYAEVPATNDWWSSLIWQFDRDGKPNPHSEPLFAHPLALRAGAGGLGLGYPSVPQVDRRSFFFPYLEELRAGVEGLDAPDTRVVRHGDWSVTARWQGPGGVSLEATFGHGLPFVYCRAAGGRPQVTVAAAEVLVDEPGVLALTTHGHAFGLFAAGGGRWARTKAGFVADRVRDGAFSIAVLPDAHPATLALFRRHAFAFVTDTRVSWRYDQAAGAVVTRYEVRTEAAERGAALEPLQALYPHQWKHTLAPLLGATYLSPRGTMKLMAGAVFETRLPFHGILPILPLVPGGSLDRSTLGGLVSAAAHAGELFPNGPDGTRGSYWTGKSLGRVALLAWLAELSGETEARQRLIAALEGQLEDWFDGQPPHYFHYDGTWHALVGVPSEYHSGWELNDHHFHYGYFVLAAATVARFDPAWARPDRFGGMVELLVRDVANPDRGDRRFPFLRHLDPYAGHSWANGPALFAEGNNEESSSEDAAFAVATFLWGALTGDRGLRDLGLFLYTQVTVAAGQYWFDVDGDNFPAGFGHRAVGMVWGSGARHDTWFAHDPVYVHGINFLPFTAGSLYLGLDPGYVRRNQQELLAEGHGPAPVWRDIVWMYQALDDPQPALAAFGRDPYLEPEFGNSRAFLADWLHGLADLGHVDATVTADAPTFAVFQRAGVRRHVAWNPAASPLRVRFSDGAALDLPPHGMVVGEAGR
jgi:endoglucanase Acf2